MYLNTEKKEKKRLPSSPLQSQKNEIKMAHINTLIYLLYKSIYWNFRLCPIIINVKSNTVFFRDGLMNWPNNMNLVQLSVSQTILPLMELFLFHHDSEMWWGGSVLQGNVFEVKSVCFRNFVALEFYPTARFAVYINILMFKYFFIYFMNLTFMEKNET
jgi:hypothetical protein